MITMGRFEGCHVFCQNMRSKFPKWTNELHTFENMLEMGSYSQIHVLHVYWLSTCVIEWPF